MKKIIALMLVMLMVVPFGIISVSADKIDLPAEPVATSDKYIIGAYDYAKQLSPVPPAAKFTNDGQTIDTLYKISAFSAWRAAIAGIDDASSTYGANSTFGYLKDGGYFVIAGKALAGLGNNWNYEGIIPATTTPLVITAKNPVDSTNYISMKDGEIYYMNESGDNAGQYGMFMMDSGTPELSNTLVFEGDVIFENIVILNRTNKAMADSGKLAPTICAKSKLVIDDTVKFASMRGEQKYTLNVAEGAYAFLHAAGFGKYTGTGTIVIDRALVEDGSINRGTFADFEGTVVDENGYNPFLPVPEDTEPEDTTPEDTTVTPPAETEPAETEPAETEPAQTTPAETEPAEDTEEPGNVPTGDATWLVAVIAAAAVIACVAVITIKKKELN